MMAVLPNMGPGNGEVRTQMTHESMHLNETPNAGIAKTSLAMSGRMDLAFPLTPLYPACTRWPDFPNREPGQGIAAALHLSGVPQ